MRVQKKIKTNNNIYHVKVCKLQCALNTRWLTLLIALIFRICATLSSVNSFPVPFIIIGIFFLFLRAVSRTLTCILKFLNLLWGGSSGNQLLNWVYMYVRVFAEKNRRKLQEMIQEYGNYWFHTYMGCTLICMRVSSARSLG